MQAVGAGEGEAERVDSSMWEEGCEGEKMWGVEGMMWEELREIRCAGGR